MVEATGRGLVVIPAYNESTSITAVVQQVRAALPETAIVVVDDCSQDDTASQAGAAGAVVLRLPVNLGDGAARQTGFKYASG